MACGLGWGGIGLEGSCPPITSARGASMGASLGRGRDPLAGWGALDPPHVYPHGQGLWESHPAAVSPWGLRDPIRP